MFSQQQQSQSKSQQQHQSLPGVVTNPRRRDIFMHLPKTLKLIFTLVKDRRIPSWRKLAFGVSVLAFLVLLLFPDIIVGLSFLLPVLGTILGIPLEAGLNWTIFALLIVSLLRIFPSEIVSEHYERIFYGREISGSKIAPGKSDPLYSNTLTTPPPQSRTH